MAAGLMGQLVTPELPSSPKRRLQEEATRGCQVCWSEFGLKGLEQRQKDLGRALESNLHMLRCILLQGRVKNTSLDLLLRRQRLPAAPLHPGVQKIICNKPLTETRVGKCAFGSYLLHFPLFPRGFSPSGFPAVGSGPPSAPGH